VGFFLGRFAALCALASLREFLFLARQAAIRLRRTPRLPEWKTQMTPMTTDVHGCHDLCSSFFIGTHPDSGLHFYLTNHTKGAPL